MNILLDTHILIWALNEPGRLPLSVAEDLTDRQNTVFFSAASIWEIGIKASLGRHDFPFDPNEISMLAIETGFRELPVFSTHGAGVLKLPWYPAILSTVCWLPKSWRCRPTFTNDDALLPYSGSLIRRI